MGRHRQVSPGRPHVTFVIGGCQRIPCGGAVMTSPTLASHSLDPEISDYEPAQSRWRKNDGLAYPQIFCRFLTAILDNIEGYLRALGQRTEARPFHRRDMDEYVFASTAVWLNKPVALGRIEPLHCSARHVVLPDKITTVKLGGKTTDEQEKTAMALRSQRRQRASLKAVPLFCGLARVRSV